MVIDMKKNVFSTALIVGIAVLILIFAGAASFLGSRVTPNPEGTIGNSAGNLNNSGLFCEYDGKVYFANSYDHNSLYSMNLAEEELRKLNDVNVCNILAGGKYLYYFQYGNSETTGFGSLRPLKSFIRCKLNGKNSASLTKDVVSKAQLVDNSLYLLVAGKSHPEFYTMKTDKSNKTLLADYEINPACASNGVIYYNGTQTDHYLYGLDTSTNSSSEIWEGNIWYPIVQGDYVYYMDVAENYRLCRYSLTQNVVEVLSEERIDCFNVNHGYIYYQTCDDNPCLKSMREDGTGVQILAEGIFTNINMTSQHVYFQAYGDEVTMYHSPLGSSTYSEFTAAKDVKTK